MESKKYVAKVKALLNIPNVVDAGKIYNLKSLKGEFPYIDFTNKEYFEEVFEEAKFKIGDKVKFIGKRDIWHNTSFDYGIEYTITKIIPQVKRGYLYMYYEVICGHDNSGFSSTYSVSENDIELIPNRFIVSFSNSNGQETPSIHQLDFQGYEHKIKDTWKEMFVFGTLYEAEECANMFAKFTMKDIISKMMHND